MRSTFLSMVVLTFIAGCSGKKDGLSTDEQSAMTVRTPDVTAEQARKELDNSEIPPEAKKVMGGGQKGN